MMRSDTTLIFSLLFSVSGEVVGREVLSVRELKEKWLKLMADMLGWGEEEDIWSYMGRIRGGWAEQFQVSIKTIRVRNTLLRSLRK